MLKVSPCADTQNAAMEKKKIDKARSLFIISPMKQLIIR